jgi:hypothetical protein
MNVLAARNGKRETRWVSLSTKYPIDPEGRKALTLGELEATACTASTVLLTFLDTTVAGNETSFLQRITKLWINIKQSLGDAVFDSTGLTGRTTTTNVDGNIKLTDIFGQFERLTHNHF